MKQHASVAPETGLPAPSRSDTLYSVVKPPTAAGSSFASMSADTLRVFVPVPGLLRLAAGPDQSRCTLKAAGQMTVLTGSKRAL